MLILKIIDGPLVVSDIDWILIFITKMNVLIIALKSLKIFLADYNQLSKRKPPTCVFGWQRNAGL